MRVTATKSEGNGARGHCSIATVRLLVNFQTPSAHKTKRRPVHVVLAIRRKLRCAGRRCQVHLLGRFFTLDQSLFPLRPRRCSAQVLFYSRRSVDVVVDLLIQGPGPAGLHNTSSTPCSTSFGTALDLHPPPCRCDRNITGGQHQSRPDSTNRYARTFSSNTSLPPATLGYGSARLFTPIPRQ